VSRASRIATVTIDENQDTTKLIESLEVDSNIEYVQEDFILSPLSVSEDQHFSRQWAIKNAGQQISDWTGLL
jgi:hypothetical protein